MAPLLTVLIPNYNRPDALARLLYGVYAAIAHAEASKLVKVLVVDDYSEADVRSAADQFSHYCNFCFRLQDRKCGNAELAFLSALNHVDTRYVWLLGNDDSVMTDSVSCILQTLRAAPDVAFVLLNPAVTKTTFSRRYVPLSCTTSRVRYASTEDLFLDFGFVTSTTTFSCLVMEAAPVRNFHNQHFLTSHATVYSHTFTMFGALRCKPALFLTDPVVDFSLNERLEEQSKLEKQAPHNIMFYHHSLGLARLVRETARITGTSIDTFGKAYEDECDKDTMRIHPTHLVNFHTHFVLEQLIREQANNFAPVPQFGYLSAEEIDEIMFVITSYKDGFAQKICDDALMISRWPEATSEWKVSFMRKAQEANWQQATLKYEQVDLPPGSTLDRPRKVAVTTLLATPLRGVPQN